MSIEALEAEHQRLCHAVQAGVAQEMSIPTDASTDPKHLRVGVNIAMCDQAALVKLLVEKGILPNMDEEDQVSLEKDVQDLLLPSEGDIIYQNTFYTPDNYSIIPCIYND